MIALQNMLKKRTHRDLELIARAHKLPFTRREPKACGLAKLSKALQDGIYQKAFKALTSEHIVALHALIVGGGWLPLPLFLAHFGEIRLYKPWKQDFYPRHPWRYPASIAEKLYHLGYIVIRDGEMVGIVDEVKAMLPPLPQAEAEASADMSLITDNNRLALLRDIAALLGVLLRVDAVPLYGRWLSLSVMREVNDCLQVQGELETVRSELQSGRIRWLHYLAQVSGLVSEQGGIFKPTVSAWQWLDTPAQFQWDCLMQAVEHDLESRERLWDVFRFPEVTAQTWCVLRHTLDGLSAEKTYRVKDIVAMLKPYLLPDKLYDIGYLLRDMFAWSGVLLLTCGRIFVHSQDFNVPTKSNVGNQLEFPLPQTSSPAFVTLLSFAQVENGMAIINQQTISDAVRQGFSSADIVQTLQNLSGKPLSGETQKQIQAWMQAANKLTLKPMIILYAPDTETIQQVRSDWRLAGHFAERISPNHLAVVAEDAHQLLHRLKRRDISVTSFVHPQSERRITETLNPDMAEYLLLAVRTYQKLHSRLDATVRIPKALTHWLTAQIDDPASIEASADVLVEAVQKQVPSTLPNEKVQGERSIQQWVTFAYQRQEPLTIDYFSPSGDGKTTRTIIVDEIYEANSYTYVDAYCHLADKVLTFRMDRILRVHETAFTQDIAV
jgi:hypothetical protein